MKKTFIFGVFTFFALTLLTGCSNGSNSNTVTSSSPTRQGQIDDFRRPDFGQPDRASDVRGLVKTLTGNEVTILKIERPQNQEGDTEDFRRSETNNDSNTNAPVLSTGRRVPGMGPGMGMGRGQRLEGEDFDEEAMLERFKSMSTGEETILVPVGIQMLRPSSSELGAEMVEASLEDIKENTMIQVWLNEEVEDRMIADFVLITR
ncbi:hypothetical protein C0584_05375 [Candidatus Parcubacteria bacterium]|nr:MAG: hypothetical protein C0584_05375 [Candidatus Parcubacteria bacterium]